MAKQKKMEVFKFSITNINPKEAAEQVAEAMKAVQEYGYEKIDVIVSVKTLKDVEPWDLV